MEVRCIDQHDDRYPVRLLLQMKEAAPPSVFTIGNPEILNKPSVGLICSIQCPGSIIIKTFDLIRQLRDRRIVVCGGFHSPMEKECLDLLLRGTQPVILCPAKGPHHLVMNEGVHKALKEGRLLVLSCFGENVRRTIIEQARFRNRMVAAFCHTLLAPHASPNGKTRSVVRQALDSGQKVVTFEDEANADLIASGAGTCGVDWLPDE